MESDQDLLASGLVLQLVQALVKAAKLITTK